MLPIPMPYSFLVAGVIIMLPETLHYIWTRPKIKAVKRQQEKTALFWRIRNLEEDIYGKWKS